MHSFQRCFRSYWNYSSSKIKQISKIRKKNSNLIICSLNLIFIEFYSYYLMISLRIILLFIFFLSLRNTPFIASASHQAYRFICKLDPLSRDIPLAAFPALSKFEFPSKILITLELIQEPFSSIERISECFRSY